MFKIKPIYGGQTIVNRVNCRQWTELKAKKDARVNILWDAHGIIFIEYLAVKETVNSDFFIT